MSVKGVLSTIAGSIAKIFNTDDLEPHRSDFEEKHRHLPLARNADGIYVDAIVQNTWVEWAKDQAWADRQW